MRLSSSPCALRRGMSFAWYDIVGTLGVASVLFAYALLQAGRVGPRDPRYLWLNLGGSVGILVSLYFAFNLASAIIQCAWIAISAYGLVRGRS